MFTIDQIKAAHSKVKSGADFPKYVQDLVALGLVRYTNYVADGHTSYFGVNNENVISAAKYPPMAIAETSDVVALRHALLIHQQGQTDYMHFCRQAAAYGVEKWVVDMGEMTCTYYSNAGDKLVVEKIPAV